MGCMADGLFVVKTIERSEAKKMLATLPEWIAHFRTNPGSLLIAPLGIYKVLTVSSCHGHFLRFSLTKSNYPFCSESLSILIVGPD